MTPETIAALKANGIAPPNRGRSTTCPKCSASRAKSWERCLKLRTRDAAQSGWVAWICYHCGWEGVA